MTSTRSPRSVAGLAGLALVVALVAAFQALAPTVALAAPTPLFEGLMVQATDGAGHGYADGTTHPHLLSDGLAFSRPSDGGAYVKSFLSGQVTLVSVNPSGVKANQPSTVVAAGGHVVLFATAATNMGLGPPTALDLYERDVANRTTVRVNKVFNGTWAAVKPGEGSINGDGTLVAFTTATVPSHVAVYDVFGKGSFDVDQSTSHILSNGSSFAPSLAADARLVAFASVGTNLVSGDTNSTTDVFVRDLVNGTTKRVSTGTGGTQLNGASSEPSIDGDGQFVAFTSSATNGASADLNNSPDVFRKDTSGGTLLLISVGTGNGSTRGNGWSEQPAIDDDGQRVAFTSDATTFWGPLGGNGDVFIRDVVAGYTDLVTEQGDPIPDKGESNPVVNADATQVAFESSSTNLTATDTNAKPDAYEQERESLGPFEDWTGLAKQQRADFGASTASSAVAADAKALANGQLTPTHLISELAHAPAWAADREPVTRLYQAFFHREPDVGGLQHWVNKHQAGTKLAAIASEFAKSSEFAHDYGHVSNQQFVTLVYQNVLGRSPDTAGLDHWVAKMAGGLSRGGVMVAFSESSEGVRHLAPQVDALLVGLGMLGGPTVEPDPHTYQLAWSTEQAVGEPEAAAYQYLMSQPYFTRISHL